MLSYSGDFSIGHIKKLVTLIQNSCQKIGALTWQSNFTTLIQRYSEDVTEQFKGYQFHYKQSVEKK